MILAIGAVTTAVLFVLQIVGVITVSGWLIAAPLLIALAWAAFWFVIVLIFAAITG